MIARFLWISGRVGIAAMAAAVVLTATAAVSAQKRRPAPRPTPVRSLAEVPTADWNKLSAAVKDEDWAKTTEMTGNYLGLIRAENAKRQLAKLRYIHLFGLAGKYLKFVDLGNRAEAEKTRGEIEVFFQNQIGREFVLPARPVASDCERKLNYVCRVADRGDALRITATNTEGDSIHSFNYFTFDAPLVLPPEKTEIVLSGILQTAEFNDDAAKPWALRLFFKNGKIGR